MTTTQHTLLTLPLEIRSLIWSHVFSPPTFLITHSSTPPELESQLTTHLLPTHLLPTHLLPTLVSHAFRTDSLPTALHNLLLSTLTIHTSPSNAWFAASAPPLLKKLGLYRINLILSADPSTDPFLTNHSDFRFLITARDRIPVLSHEITSISHLLIHHSTPIVLMSSNHNSLVPEYDEVLNLTPTSSTSSSPATTLPPSLTKWFLQISSYQWRLFGDVVEGVSTFSFSRGYPDPGCSSAIYVEILADLKTWEIRSISWYSVDSSTRLRTPMTEQEVANAYDEYLHEE